MLKFVWKLGSQKILKTNELEWGGVNISNQKLFVSELRLLGLKTLSNTGMPGVSQSPHADTCCLKASGRAVSLLLEVACSQVACSQTKAEYLFPTIVPKRSQEILASLGF